MSDNSTSFPIVTVPIVPWIGQDGPAAERIKLPNEFLGETKASYAYQYDGYGNWTQQTVNHSTKFGEASSICHRTLTYY